MARTQEFRPDVEGLRALAVLLVVAFHYAAPGLGGGFVGVDVFFVISGYLITGLLLRELDASEGLDLLRFYGRRARRLLPALAVVSAATLAVAPAILSPIETMEVSRSALAAAAYVSNFWFMTRAFDYFAPETAANPVVHTWSLAVEEQFYLLWPALILAVAKWRRGLVVPVIVGVTVLSFLACMAMVARQQAWAFYSPLTRAWEFGVGAMAVALHGQRIGARPVLLAGGGLCAIVLSALLLDESAVFPGWSALAPVLGTAAVLVAGASNNAVSAVLARPAMVWIGKLSYSIYLWHWPVLVLSGIAWPGLPASGRLACLVAALGCAAASYYVVERPIRSSPWLGRVRRRPIYLAAALTCAGMVIAARAFLAADDATSVPFQQAAQQAAQSQPLVIRDTRGCVASLLQEAPNPCEFRAASTRGTVMLVGDSHAAQWFTPVFAFATANGMKLVTYLKSSCAVSDVAVFSSRLRREFPECARWREAVMARVAAAKPDLVILAQHSHGYVRREGVPALRTQTSGRDAWAAGLGRVVRQLRAAGTPVLVLADTPFPRLNVPTCLSRGSADSPVRAAECSRPAREAVDAELAAAESRTVQAQGGFYLDMTGFFCPAAHCPAIRAGTILYRDTNHINEEYARTLVEPISIAMRRALDAPRRELRQGEGQGSL